MAQGPRQSQVRRRIEDHPGRAAGVEVLPGQQVQQWPVARQHRRLLGQQRALLHQDLGGAGLHHPR